MIQPIKALKQKQVVEMVVKGSTRIIVNLSVGILLPPPFSCLVSIFLEIMNSELSLKPYKFNVPFVFLHLLFS